jgi:iron-sulfur cluster repair protein YtfE (RIC family)
VGTQIAAPEVHACLCDDDRFKKANPEEESGMNAITLLKEDHERAMELIEQIESLDENDSQAGDLFGQLKQALTLHTQMEEKVFYPALIQFEETKEIVEEAYKEHQEVDDLLADISNLSLGDEEFLDQIAELKEKIEHHVGEEEDELFPEAEKLLGESRIRELGMQMEQLNKGKTATASKRK